MKLKTLSFKTFINELDFLDNAVIIQWKAWKKKKKRFIVAQKQTNSKNT